MGGGRPRRPHRWLLAGGVPAAVRGGGRRAARGLERRLAVSRAGMPPVSDSMALKAVGAGWPQRRCRAARSRSAASGAPPSTAAVRGRFGGIARGEVVAARDVQGFAGEASAPPPHRLSGVFPAYW